MNGSLNAFRTWAKSLLKDDDGAQVVEYALIIAVVSIALVLALQALTTGTSFSDFITRVGNCLKTGGTCA
ncbi:Flp pilus assembly protein, pilin Flp [Variovorax sp. PBL-H6]|uniref:Flp family type IVb pilin n=1 Tax=Variovorax sp. PBL-H6 TaxID=434009 RepID=UPI001316847E|nr:Flp family type IVb pilin [Variovorax sp. PBL-H6]VTU22025.1 Flp pilus assembly protein, pilin Flp [Variovorax sp. PBL-H6]